MKKLVVVLFFIAGIACMHKTSLTPAEVEKNLMEAMTGDLYKKAIGRFDTATLHYEVKEVTYFEEKAYYECEFKVHMKQNSFDTTGIMAARISKDFKQVARKI